MAGNLNINPETLVCCMDKMGVSMGGGGWVKGLVKACQTASYLSFVLPTSACLEAAVFFVLKLVPF